MDLDKAKTIGKKLLPLLSVVFILAVGYFLYEILSVINWREVKTALAQVSLDTFALAGAAGILSYLLLTTYDFMGFHFLKTRALKYARVMPTALVCYAFNFNLGAFIGGLGFRIRIYSGWGVPKKTIPLVALFSVVTTWMGYAFLISAVFTFRPAWTGQELPVSSGTASFLGLFGFMIVFAYMALSWKGQKFSFKNYHLRFPKLSIVSMQLLLSTIQWCLPPAIIYVFLSNFGIELEYGETLFTFLIASIGGVVARIPAGLGVTEAIFLKMNPHLHAPALLAALLCFRAVYFLLPLALAVPGYGLIEYLQKRSR